MKYVFYVLYILSLGVALVVSIYYMNKLTLEVYDKPVSKVDNDDTDTMFMKIRYETSDDLVNSLDSIEINKIYDVKCNDNKVRKVKVVIIDRKKERVGIIALQGVGDVGGNLGGRSYDANALGFVSIKWFKNACQ